MAGSAALAAIGRGDTPAPALLPQAPRAALGEEAAPAPRATEGGMLGVILARASVDVGAPAEGRLSAVEVRLGDHVRAGGRIARLDLPSARSELEVAEASARSAEIEIDRTRIELADAEERLTRRQALSTQALTTGEDLAAARYQAKLAQVRVDAAVGRLREQRARAEQLRQENAEAEIRAPFDGIVAVRYADPGARVGRGQPIVRLIAASERFVRFAVPEEQAAELAVGQPVRVAASRLELTGRVEKIAPEIDAASRMVFVEAGLEESAGALGPMLSGEIARVSLPVPPRK
jgi:RND family efflux transporter MFP subunit